jgi:hypothetical protein
MLGQAHKSCEVVCRVHTMYYDGDRPRVTPVKSVLDFLAPETSKINQGGFSSQLRLVFSLSLAVLQPIDDYVTPPFCFFGGSGRPAD